MNLVLLISFILDKKKTPFHGRQKTKYLAPIFKTSCRFTLLKVSESKKEIPHTNFKCLYIDFVVKPLRFAMENFFPDSPVRQQHKKQTLSQILWSKPVCRQLHITF